MTQEQSSATTEVQDSTTQPVGETVEGSTPAPEVTWLQIDRTRIPDELRRLQAEDPEFRNHLNTLVGQKAKRDYDRRLAPLAAELESLRFEKRVAEINAMKPEDIEEAFAKDPEFAQEYARAVHYKRPEPPAPVVDETPKIESAFRELWGGFQKLGMTEDQLRPYAVRAAEGEFGTDDEVHWTVILTRLGTAITADLAKSGKPADTTSKVNPKLAGGSADTSRTGTGGVAPGWPTTVAEFKKLSTADQRALLNSEGGNDRLNELLAKG